MQIKYEKNLTQDEINKINSIWAQCDTQNEANETVNGGDGKLNQNELALFKNKVLGVSENLYNQVTAFLKENSLQNERPQNNPPTHIQLTENPEEYFKNIKEVNYDDYSEENILKIFPPEKYNILKSESQNEEEYIISDLTGKEILVIKRDSFTTTFSYKQNDGSVKTYFLEEGEDIVYSIENNDSKKGYLLTSNQLIYIENKNTNENRSYYENGAIESITESNGRETHYGVDGDILFIHETEESLAEALGNITKTIHKANLQPKELLNLISTNCHTLISTYLALALSIVSISSPQLNELVFQLKRNVRSNYFLPPLEFLKHE